MSKASYVIVFILIASVFNLPNAVQAQYIIEQLEYTLPVNYDLVPEDVEFEEMQDEALFFLNLDEAKLKQSAEMNGEEPEITKSTVYISGNNFAFESNTEQGKISMISDFDKGMFYYVLWAQKKVFTISKEDMQKIQDQTKTATEAMLSKLSPEMRAQMEENMENMKNEPPEKAVVKTIGKKAQKYGFSCEQYMVQKEEEIQTVWVTGDVSGLTQKMKGVSEQMEKIFPSEAGDNNDEWDLIPGKIPIETRTYRASMTDGPEIAIEATTKIDQTMPPAEKFTPPGQSEGFTTGSMADMMQQMMQMIGGEE
jgi:hypothetical protein